MKKKIENEIPKRLKMAWKKRNCAHFKTRSTICPDFWHVAHDIYWRTLCLPKRMYVRNWRCNDINRLWGSTAVLVWALRQQSKLGYGLYKRFWPGSVRAVAKHRLVSNVAASCVFFTKSTVICLGTEYDDNSNKVIFILPQNWNEHLPLQECLLRNCIDTFFFVNWVCVDTSCTRDTSSWSSATSLFTRSPEIDLLSFSCSVMIFTEEQRCAHLSAYNTFLDIMVTVSSYVKDLPEQPLVFWMPL